MNITKTPTAVKLHKRSAVLELTYADDAHFFLKAEYLRVHSPSAEVRGHGKGQEILQVGKKYVKISAIEPVGNYGIKLLFDDKHDTGIYSWEYLEELGNNHDSLWEAYLGRLQSANANREPLPPGAQFVNIIPIDATVKSADQEPDKQS
jgi:DUF971 family protein